MAQTGTEIPEIGVVDQILPPDFVGFFPDAFPYPWFGEVINDSGQVLLPVALEDGSGAPALGYAQSRFTRLGK